MHESQIALFQGKNIRRIVYQDQWWFSVIDVVGVLSGSEIAKRYWSDLKIKLRNEGFDEVYDKIVRLKLMAIDGRLRETDCANTETLFRIIQAIPSPKAEPFKRWLARIGYERIQEIEDPELATKRTRELYKAKGYTDAWIEKRIRGIAIREELTNEWKTREVGKDREYAILTAEISKATFDMTPSEYKKFKNLDRQNLRDHMDDLELIFSMLGEASTTRITQATNAQGFVKNRDAAVQGGSIAGNARRELESKSGKKVSTSKNYILVSQKVKSIKL